MRVYAVIVCYNPDVARLRQTCDSLSGDATVILVDNSMDGFLEIEPQFGDCILIRNGQNLGIAAAQNRGICRAIADGAEAVVFFDQDSRIGPGFVAEILSPLVVGRPGVSAPVYRDEVRGFEYPSLVLSRFGTLRQIRSTGRVAPYEVDVVMSSGSAATVETFYLAGMMDEDFFIDYVDTEWCLRCRARGISIVVVPTATLAHSVGQRAVRLGILTLLVYSPLRCYYQIRNCIRLFDKESVPLLLAIREAATLAVHKALLLLFVPHRIAYLRAYASALRDGATRAIGLKPGQA